jgi:plasmid stability protein
MPLTLSIKNVPDALAERLKQRAARHHRSLQGELMAIIEAAAEPHPLSLRELSDFATRLGLRSPSGHSARMVREDRDDPGR